MSEKSTQKIPRIDLDINNRKTGMLERIDPDATMSEPADQTPRVSSERISSDKRQTLEMPAVEAPSTWGDWYTSRKQLLKDGWNSLFGKKESSKQLEQKAEQEIGMINNLADKTTSDEQAASNAAIQKIEHIAATEKLPIDKQNIEQQGKRFIDRVTTLKTTLFGKERQIANDIKETFVNKESKEEGAVQILLQEKQKLTKDLDALAQARDREQQKFEEIQKRTFNLSQKSEIDAMMRKIADQGKIIKELTTKKPEQYSPAAKEFLSLQNKKAEFELSQGRLSDIEETTNAKKKESGLIDKVIHNIKIGDHMIAEAHLFDLIGLAEDGGETEKSYSLRTALGSLRNTDENQLAKKLDMAFPQVDYSNTRPQENRSLDDIFSSKPIIPDTVTDEQIDAFLSAKPLAKYDYSTLTPAQITAYTPEKRREIAQAIEERISDQVNDSGANADRTKLQALAKTLQQIRSVDMPNNSSSDRADVKQAARFQELYNASEIAPAADRSEAVQTYDRLKDAVQKNGQKLITDASTTKQLAAKLLKVNFPTTTHQIGSRIYQTLNISSAEKNQAVLRAQELVRTLNDKDKNVVTNFITALDQNQAYAQQVAELQEAFDVAYPTSTTPDNLSAFEDLTTSPQGQAAKPRGKPERFKNAKIEYAKKDPTQESMADIDSIEEDHPDVMINFAEDDIKVPSDESFETTLNEGLASEDEVVGDTNDLVEDTEEELTEKDFEIVEIHGETETTLEAASFTIASREHSNTNEDASAKNPDAHVYAICDGVGSYSSADVAAQITVRTIIEASKKPGSLLSQKEGLTPQQREQTVEEMKQVFAQAHTELISNEKKQKDLIKKSGGEYKGMGTTALQLKIDGNYLMAAGLGDSGILSFNPDNGKLDWILQPDSAMSNILTKISPKIIKELGITSKLKDNLIWITENATAADKLTYADGQPLSPPDKEFVLNNIFTSEKVSPNITDKLVRNLLKGLRRNATGSGIFTFQKFNPDAINTAIHELKPGEIVLPCTDGLTDALSLKTIQEYLQKNYTKSPGEIAKGLAEFAASVYQNAGNDQNLRTKDKRADDITLEVIKTKQEKLADIIPITQNNNRPPQPPPSPISGSKSGKITKAA